MGLLTTLCKQKTSMGLDESNTASDETLILLIEEVSSLVEEYCGRKFGTATVTEFYSGDNTPVLVLRQRPVAAIINIWTSERGYWGQGEDAFDSDALLVAGDDYVLEKDQSDGSSRCGLVHRLNGVWSRPFVVDAGNLSAWAPEGTGNVKVQYTAGFGAIPGGVALAVQLTVARFWKTMKNGGLVTSSETTPGYSYTLATNQLKSQGVMAFPDEAVAMLARYRNLAIG